MHTCRPRLASNLSAWNRPAKLGPMDSSTIREWHAITIRRFVKQK